MSKRRQRHPREFLARLWALDGLLGAAGMPPISSWWRQTLTRYYLSGRRRLVVRKGRQVGASTIVAPRVAVAEMLWGEHHHNPGAPPLMFAFLSVKRSEASNRLRGVRAVLDALHEPYTERGDTIELTNRPAIFAVVTRDFRTSVGDVVAFAWLDEVSRWRDETSSRSNPAAEVVAAIAPATVTQPNAKMFLVSTPLGNKDYHARQYDLGETVAQCVARCATWEGNPTLTEADTREIEPLESAWRREFAAIPSDADFQSFFGEFALTRSVDIGRSGPPPLVPGAGHVIGVDAAFTEYGDRFGWGVVTYNFGSYNSSTGTRELPILCVHDTAAWKADRDAREMARRLRTDVCARYRTNLVYADQHEQSSWPLLAKDVGLKVRIVPWTASDGLEGKTAKFKAVRAKAATGEFRLPDDPSLLDEFRSVFVEILASGYERIVIPRNASGHGDRVSAIVLASSIALAKPKLSPAVWTFEEYVEKRHAYQQTCAALGAQFFHPVFHDQGECLSYPALRRAIATGEIRL